MTRIVKDDIDRLYEKGLCTKTRVLYLGGLAGDDVGGDNDFVDETPIYWNTARRLIMGLHVLDSNARNGDKPITIIMNSCGGEWSHGMAIYDAIRQCKNHVTIINMSHARSMTSLIFQAADYRITAPSGYYMIHDGEMATSGVPKTVINTTEYEKQVALPMMYNIYLARLNELDEDGERKVSLATVADIINKKLPDGAEKVRRDRPVKLTHIEQLCSRDTFFTPEEMIRLNFVDRMLQQNDLAGAFANPDMHGLPTGQQSLEDDDWTSAE